MTIDTFIWDVVLPKMFDKVSLPNDKEYIRKFTKQDNWFTLKTWTDVEQYSFQEWLVNELRIKQKLPKYRAEKEALWFILCYGWKQSVKEAV